MLRFFDLSNVALGHTVLSDELPLGIRLRINDKEATLPPYIPPSKAGVEPKRQKKPVNITPEVAKNHFQLNSKLFIDPKCT